MCSPSFATTVKVYSSCTTAAVGVRACDVRASMVAQAGLWWRKKHYFVHYAYYCRDDRWEGSDDGERQGQEAHPPLQSRATELFFSSNNISISNSNNNSNSSSRTREQSTCPEHTPPYFASHAGQRGLEQSRKIPSSMPAVEILLYGDFIIFSMVRLAGFHHHYCCLSKAFLAKTKKRENDSLVDSITDH